MNTSIPAQIAELLARAAADLTRDEVHDLAADAATRSSWELVGHRDHVEEICARLGQLEHELALRDEQIAKLTEQCIEEGVDDTRPIRKSAASWSARIAYSPDKQIVDVVEAVRQ